VWFPQGGAVDFGAMRYGHPVDGAL
jgi:hypothetical protein